MRFIFPLFLIILSVTACRAEPSNDKLVDTGVQIKTETVAAGLDHPWAVEFLPGGEFLVTERPGILYRISSDGTKTEIKNTPDVYNR